MKTPRMYFLALLLPILFVGTWAFANLGPSDAFAEDQQPEHAVAKLNEGSPPTILFSNLVNTLTTGGEVEQFNVGQFGQQWKLIRKGHQGTNARTEMFNLSATSSGWLIVIGPPVWYTVCSKSSCNSFCTPNPQGNACDCSGSNCNFGGEGPVGVEVVVLD